MTYKSTVSLLLLLTGISGVTLLQSAPEKSETENSLIFHAVYSENLREIMHRLNQSIYDRELETTQDESVRMQYTRQLFDEASELYLAAEKLTQALPGFDLSEVEKDVFEGLARQLQIEANNLGYMSKNNDQHGMDAVFKRLNDTCAACHELFRF